MQFKDISETYVINLPENLDRFFNVSENLEINGIDFKLWVATKNSNGADGLKQTVKELFNYCLKRSGDFFLIMEDDCELLFPDSKELIGKALNDLPNDFHILQLGCNLLMPPLKVTDNLFKVIASYALHCVVYSRRAMMEILKFIDHSEPLDVLIAKHLQPLGKCYCSNPMIATQRPYKSDIFEYNPQMHKGIENIYNADTKVIDWGKFMNMQWERNTKHL